MDQRRFRVYLDFCPGGDLFSALRDHFNAWNVGLKTVKDARREVRMRTEREAQEGHEKGKKRLLEDEEQAADEEQPPNLDDYAVIPEGLICKS